jgi:PAS domain S-box-containing protein
MRLRDYLAVLALATLLPVAIFAAVVGYFLVGEQRETFRRGAEERTLAVLTAIDNELDISISTLKALATLPELDAGDLVTFRNHAERILATQPQWANVNLALPSGQQVMNLQVPPGAPLPDIGDLDGSFARLRQTGKPVVSDLAVGPVLKRWSFAVRVPVVREGRLKYVLSAGVKPESISAVIKAQGLPEGWVGVVVDRNGRIVARNLDPERTQGQMASQSLREGLARSASGWLRGSTLEGAEVYTPYRRSDGSGWAFAMGIPARTVDAAAWRGALLLVLGLVAAISLAAWLARVVGRRLAKPIAELAQASAALAQGAQVRVPDNARVKEVRLLADTFRASIEAVREREAALAASEEQMRSVVDHVVDGIITIDERGAMQTFNRAAERIFGYAASEVMGQNVKVLMPDPYHREHDSYLANYVRTGQARIIGIGREVEGRRKDGSTFPLDLGVSEFHIGSRRHFTGVVRDITERKRAEEALRAADRAKDEFLAMLSHELRNPLAGLTAASHVLGVAQPSSEEARKARGVVERQTKHMARLVADLLDVSRVTLGKLSLERARFNVADAVSNVVDLWRASGRLDAHRVSLAAEPAWVHGDRARLEQIAANLLDNALKFTPAGGAVAISVRREGGEAVVRVADEGVGLQAEECERVFELFVQTGASQRANGGLGIGLALVKRLAELHGGSASAASEGRGRGAVFTIRLPAVEPAAIRAEEPPRRVDGARSILIVEDNDDARQMLAAMLALGGHVVHAARDGQTALALAATVAPDLALIDVALTDMDGYEVARRLRAARSGRRIGLVAVTGFGQQEDQRRAFEAGFDAHLVKPVSRERLERVISELK